MATTIMVSNELKSELNALKLFSGETYENVIKDLIDDRKALSAETIKDLEEAKKDVAEGQVVSFEEIKRKMNSNV